MATSHRCHKPLANDNLARKEFKIQALGLEKYDALIEIRRKTNWRERCAGSYYSVYKCNLLRKDPTTWFLLLEEMSHTYRTGQKSRGW